MVDPLAALVFALVTLFTGTASLLFFVARMVFTGRLASPGEMARLLKSYDERGKALDAERERNAELNAMVNRMLSAVDRAPAGEV